MKDNTTTNTFKVIPKLDYHLLGTDIKLKAGQTYQAVDATNQPDWKARGLIFVLLDANDQDGPSMLLERAEYDRAQDDVTMTADQARAIVQGFLDLVRGRSGVRLDFRNYWSGDRLASVEAYRGDRNMIRRQTLAFDKAWRDIAWRNQHDLACALICASRSSRIEWNHDRQAWSYCAGQYMPTEIRAQGAMVASTAKRMMA